MPRSNDSNRAALRVLIKSTSQGLQQIQLCPWPDHQPSPVDKIHIFLQGECSFREALQHDLRAYFFGQPVNFSEYPVDWQDMTPFVRKVLEVTRSIPWGETRTYGWLSEQLKPKSGARAAGGALGRNPLPLLIPCHRIIRKGGGMGGFSAGILWKSFLLSLENRENMESNSMESNSAVKTPSVEFLE